MDFFVFPMARPTLFTSVCFHFTAAFLDFRVLSRLNSERGRNDLSNLAVMFYSFLMAFDCKSAVVFQGEVVQM
jgi:ABC-type maltose transport system permease subunit